MHEKMKAGLVMILGWAGVGLNEIMSVATQGMQFATVLFTCLGSYAGWRFLVKRSRLLEKQKHDEKD